MQVETARPDQAVLHQGSPAIQVVGARKTYGQVCAVDRVTFQVRTGTVTGILGPNGAGKTTTLRMLLGLTAADRGELLVAGRAYAELTRPMSVIGAALETSGFATRRTGRNHLRAYAPMAGASRERVEHLLALVGLSDAADRRVGGYSQGMRQRLALATALLGDPQILVLDEPTNGLDPAGIVWLRGFLRDFAAAGRAVLLSSHLLREVEQTIDDVVLIHTGRTVFNGPLAELVGPHRQPDLETAFLALTTGV